jgi:hypothetical protein
MSISTRDLRYEGQLYQARVASIPFLSDLEITPETPLKQIRDQLKNVSLTPA